MPLPRRNRTNLHRALTFILAGVVAALLLMAFKDFTHRAEASAKNNATDNAPHATVAPLPTLPCPDSWKREAQHIGDHRSDDISNFDVGPTPAGCFSELIYAPSDWNRWSKMVVGGKPDCLTWFWPFGSERPIGPFKPNELPEFPVTAPHPWRISTECTIKYFRTV